MQARPEISPSKNIEKRCSYAQIVPKTMFATSEINRIGDLHISHISWDRFFVKTLVSSSRCGASVTGFSYWDRGIAYEESCHWLCGAGNGHRK